MNYIVSSATTYQGKHPSMNIIYLDPETMLPVDYETHYMDLTESNKLADNEKPVWKQKYNYRDYFHLEDLSPKSFWDHANYQIFYNETACIEYRRHRSIDGPAGAGDYPCDQFMRRMFFCQTTTDGYDDWNVCMGNPQKNWEFGRSKDEGIFATLENFVAHNWYTPKK